MLILLFPNFVTANSVCIDYWDRCYDTNMNVQVGDVFNWTIIENMENGQPFNYGDNHDPQGKLKISIEILNEFKGLNQDEINRYPKHFFKINTTINEKQVKGSWGANDSLPFVGYYIAIYHWHHFISTTRIMVQDQNLNYYQYLVDESASGRGNVRQNRDNHMVSYNQSINQEIHELTEYIFYSGDPLSRTSLREIKTDIRSGIVLQIKAEVKNLRENRSSKVVIGTIILILLN